MDVSAWWCMGGLAQCARDAAGRPRYAVGFGSGFADLGQRGNHEHVSQLQTCDDDPSSEIGEIVFVGVSNAFEDSVNAETLDAA